MSALGDIVANHGGLIQTGPFGSQLHEYEYTKVGVPVVMPKDIVSGKINFESIARVSEEKAGRLQRHKLQAGDIVFPRRGDIGKCAFVSERDKGCLCGTGCLKISVPESVLLPRFLFYFLGLPESVKWLENNSTGSTMMNLNTNTLGRLEIPDFPVEEQRRIADILSAYDDLIENNRRRVAILEETARLAYRKWFGKASEQKEWRICKVADVLDSFHRPPKVPKELYIQEGEYPCIDQGKDFIGGYTNDMNAVVDRVPAIVFGDHTRVLKYVSRPFACGADGTQLLFAKKGCLTQEYLYLALKEIDLTNYFYARHFKILKSKSILVPPYYLVEEFSNQVRGNMDMIGALRDYNVKLASARDMLLPRLMKGESVL